MLCGPLPLQAPLMQSHAGAVLMHCAGDAAVCGALRGYASQMHLHLLFQAIPLKVRHVRHVRQKLTFFLT